MISSTQPSSSTETQKKKELLKKEFQTITNSLFKVADYFTQIAKLVGSQNDTENSHIIKIENFDYCPVDNEDSIRENIQKNFLNNLEHIKNNGEFTKNNTKRLRMRVSGDDNIVALIKIYPVKTNTEENIKTAYRVFVKYLSTTICIGPYQSYQFALNLKRGIQKELLKFNPKKPDVEKYVKFCLDEIKKVMDENYPPVKMKKNSHNL